MKILVVVLACILSISLCFCAEVKSYHYDVFILNSEFPKSVSSGDGSPDSCKLLFNPPASYIGIMVVIPKNAVVFGVVTVTDGHTCKVIPLFEWVDEKGDIKCACNGPQPKFALDGKNRDDLVNAIVNVIKKQ